MMSMRLLVLLSAVSTPTIPPESSSPDSSAIDWKLVVSIVAAGTAIVAAIIAAVRAGAAKRSAAAAESAAVTASAAMKQRHLEGAQALLATSKELLTQCSELWRAADEHKGQQGPVAKARALLEQYKKRCGCDQILTEANQLYVKIVAYAEAVIRIAHDITEEVTKPRAANGAAKKSEEAKAASWQQAKRLRDEAEAARCAYEQKMDQLAKDIEAVLARRKQTVP